MAVFCLASDLGDLKKRLGRIIVAYDTGRQSRDLRPQIGAAGAMTALLRDAFSPNLVQTLEGTPCLIHGGPFANIAHGCNSVAATTLAMKMADYVVTEAGFGADLGAEKFLDIKCRMNGLWPDAVVIVVTLRALKHHGGVDKAEWAKPDLAALMKGMDNLMTHIGNIRTVWQIPAVVSINRLFDRRRRGNRGAVRGPARQRRRLCAVRGLGEGW